MPEKNSSKLVCLAALIAVVASLAGCGEKLDGTYSGRGTGFLDKLQFTSGDKVELSFMGMTKEGRYVIEGNKVKITAGADTQIFTIDDKGCLVGGGILGKYCKGGTEAARAESKGKTASASASDGIAGAYRAGDASRGITLDFQTDQKVRITMSQAGRKSESADGSYAVSGKRITVTIPGGTPLKLTRTGDALEGSVDGTPIKFVKK